MTSNELFQEIERRLSDKDWTPTPATSKELAEAVIDLHKRLLAVERWQEVADERAMGDDA